MIGTLFLKAMIIINFLVFKNYGTRYLLPKMCIRDRLNIDYVNDKRYLGVNNLILHHEIFNFDFLFNDLSHSILPMDF